MTKVDEAPKARLEKPAHPVPKEARTRPFIVEFYGSAIAKKWLMAITGIMLMGFVFAHMVGNLKVYLGADDLNHYGEWLREMGEPIFPRTVLLWIMRIGLIGAFAVHIVSAAQLTRMNRKARPDKYESPRDYAAANFASRTMRWTGVIVGLFVIFHLLDLTWGATGADWTRGEVYENLVASFQRVPVAIVYILANIALGIHLYHGGWSMFQSLGWNNRKFNDWRRLFAIGFAAIIVVGNVSIPLLVVTGVVD
ncbi:MAG: succinate dehydrogenase cytochrome b subunit [Actinobacteria bacterium]|nr:succinate dehydrogenase cytochrome b subunit [Actinomycetota bacterium]